jgi:6-phosphofructokinase 1
MDRVLGTKFGVAAVELVAEKKFGCMVSLDGNKIISVPLRRAVEKLKVVDKGLYDMTKVFFG